MCIDCGKCAIVCPHAVIRMKVYDPTPPSTRRPAGSSPRRSGPRASGPPPHDPGRTRTTAPDAGSASRCVPPRTRPNEGRKAINMEPQSSTSEHRARRAGTSSSRSPSSTGRRSAHDSVKTSQLLEPLFEFCGACSRLRRDAVPQVAHAALRRPAGRRQRHRLLVDLRRQPADDAVDHECRGPGPAWCNSLFEDNAEFGLGLRLGARRTSRPRRATLLVAVGDETSVSNSSRRWFGAAAR